jgi:hypothetical protein
MQLDHGGIVVDLLTVLIFITLHFAFFVYVASREVDVTVQKKGGMLQRLRTLLLGQNQLTAVSLLDAQMRQQEIDVVAEAAAEVQEQTAANHSLLLKWMLPPILLVVVATVAILVLGYREQPADKRSILALFKPHDRLGLLLLVFAYAAEILFFLLVIRRHVHLGDVALGKQIWAGCE